MSGSKNRERIEALEQELESIKDMLAWRRKVENSPPFADKVWQAMMRCAGCHTVRQGSGVYEHSHDCKYRSVR